MSKAIEVTKVAVNEFTAEMIDQKYDNTSKKIRYLSSLDYKVAEIEKIFQNIGVTTKEGKPIRYQHVRNILMTKISDK